MHTTPRKSKNYTDKFKKQIVALRKNGKTILELSRKYDVVKSTINKWVSDYSNTSFTLKKKSRKYNTELEKKWTVFVADTPIMKQRIFLVAIIFFDFSLYVTPTTSSNMVDHYLPKLHTTRYKENIYHHIL